MTGLTIPDRLYGRGGEVDLLLESFERISSGHGEVLLVPGASGVGKTALVQQLQGPIRDRNGFFIRGKFEQYQQNVPYFAFRQALAGLCQELQSRDPQQRSRFKANILQAVGNLGQVLVGLAPEFGVFLGAQPPLEEVSPQEARHRFAALCRSLFKVVCWPEHPLVLFIDDWQWADAASCELLKQMQVGTTLRYLLLIASYRDNEVSADHPLTSAVDALRSHAVPVEVLPIGNITTSDVQSLVADTLLPATEDAAGLAALIYATTRGNPFFVRSFLGFLHELELIRFDQARRSWRWPADLIRSTELPGDVVELFVQRLLRLDPESRELFSLAACLGNRFELDALSAISGRAPGDCLERLCSSQAAALILPPQGGAAGAPDACAFVHDSVQQAAYSLIEPAERPAILLNIGRLLLASLDPNKLEERLFEVVNDLNAGRHLLQDTAELEQLVELNVAAARKAHAATAYRAALQYYQAASSALETPGLGDHLWRERHALIMQLFIERAECEFLEGSSTDARQCIQRAVAHAGTPIEKAEALNVLIVQYTLLARYPAAIAAGRQALAALEISLPEDDYEAARDDEIARVRRQLEGRPVASLSELPIMSHPETLMASRIMITMGPPCYRSHQRLWSVIVPKVVNLTLRHGNIPQVGYSHTAFGGLLGWVEDDYATAREFGELATQLMTDTFQSPSDQSVFYLMIGSSLRHWSRHLRYGSRDYADAYEIGLRSHNLQYAAYAFGHDMYCRFYQGHLLSDLIQETQHSLEFSRTRRNQWAMDLLEGGLNIFRALTGEGPALEGSAARGDQAYLQRVEDHQNIQVTCIYKILKTCSLLVSGDHERALALSDEVEPLLYTVGTQGLLPWPEHVFVRLLVLASLYPAADEERRASWRSELDLLLGRLRTWADSCPENFEHKYLLAAAELARIDGRQRAAVELYDQAIDAARSGSFLQWESIANERAHGFWSACGNERVAQGYWRQAYLCFDRWGAAAKVQALEAAYAAHVARSLSAGDGSGEPAGGRDQALTSAFVERQLGQLRTEADGLKHAGQQIDAATRADDLAHAMQRVRAEIVERRRTEAALRESEHSLREAQTIAGLGSYVLDLPSGSWRSSDVLDGVLGIDQEYERSVEGWAALIHPDDRAVMVDYLMQDVIGRGEAFERDYRIVRHDDHTERWVHGLGKLELDAGGRPLTLRGTIQDITERRQMDEKLRQLSRAVEQSPTSIIITNPAGEIEYVNPSFVEVTGYTAAEVVGENPRILKSGEMSPEAYRELWQTITAGKEWRGEFHNRKKSGELYWESASISPIRDAAATITHFVAVKEDITARKQTEADRDQLIQDLQAAVANVKSLTGLLPICAACKKIRDDKGYWNQVERYIGEHSEATFSHGMCPECVEKWYPKE